MIDKGVIKMMIDRAGTLFRVEKKKKKERSKDSRRKRLLSMVHIYIIKLNQGTKTKPESIDSSGFSILWTVVLSSIYK